MIKYYKELEEKTTQYLKLVDTHITPENVIENDLVPLEFYIRNYNFFEQLPKLDTIKIKEDKIILELLNFYEVEDVCDYLINDENNLKYKINHLLTKFKYKENTYQYYEYLRLYITSIIKLNVLNSNIDINSRSNLVEYFKTFKTVAKLQGNLSTKLEKEIDSKIKELDKYSFKLPNNKKIVNFLLPDSWYITPSGELYNSMGEDGHKGSNLQYAYLEQINNETEYTSKYYLDKLLTIEENNFISKSEFKLYLNLIYNFEGLFADKTYDRKIIQLIKGIYSANACFYSFFEELKEKSSNYEENLNLIKKIDMDDLLVRTCGFHKVSSLFDKRITTSCINYNQEFYEYLKKGWTIDFIPPIIINEQNGKLEDYPKEYLTIKKILKK